MSRYEITHFFSNSGSRNEVRMRVVEYLSREEPGQGQESLASRYIYYVEQLKDGNRVYLQRPANLHNGFDFLVCVENTNYASEGKRKRNYPKHDDFKYDLAAKKFENTHMYSRLYDVLFRVYNCEDVPESDYSDITFNTGLPVDHIVKTIKWLFIEQDIRYWNYSGRAMTWGLVPDK
ncbi:hypothetical protein SAMN02910298_02244 [Pseudobutyrivibrio sp. YE44]|uniref:DNA adenine methylase n=1 Tax=Pseudobutyrivibrio sp. YE44 TaxID=1520802 RepID=UPI00087F912B|nr:DNA adenine methylase [Pseudobutyrivibrio sp. YE44]SDB45036.1 hypothetical protein SAMN02910298_02244 [Pseudobutyrivibrio sp. YE44]